MRLGILLLLASAAFAQTAKFEVASVRPTSLPPEEDIVRMGMNVDGNRVEFSLLSLFELMRRAFNVSPLLLEAPEWADEQLYDIAALMPAGTTREQIPQMLEALLRERFQLVIRREQREREVQVLVVAKGGHKMKPANAADRGFRINSDGRHDRIQTVNTMSDLAEFVGNMKNIPVLDRTGLTGAFEVDFELGADPDFGGISVSLESMGLRLENQKAVVEFIVVESAQRQPSEN